MIVPDKDRRARPDALHTAPEAVHYTLETIHDRREQVISGTALANVWGIPEIDNYVNPYWQGQTIYVVAMMSNGKSYIARMHALSVMQSLMRNNSNKVVVWITNEEPVEKVTASWLSVMSQVSSSSIISGRTTDVEMRQLTQYIAEVTTWPLFIIGNSVSKRDESGKREKSVSMTRTRVEDCIDYIINVLGLDIAFMVLDYLQATEFEDDDYSRMEPHMRKTVAWCRQMAVWAACPFEICAQAPRSLTEKKLAIPGMTHIEWTNKAGQDADLVYGSLFPKTTNGIGTTLENITLFNGMLTHLPVSKRHMFMRIAKQREGDAGDMFLLEAYPELMKWRLLDPTRIALNPDKRVQETLEHVERMQTEQQLNLY